MTGEDRPGEALTAALIQISGHAERIAALDDRYQRLAEELGVVAAQAAVAADSAGRGDMDVIGSLDSLERQVAGLAARLAALAGEDDDAGQAGGYQPVPAPRWWRTAGTEREESLGRLRAWVGQIYVPSYGQLAALLPACWEQHPVCLYALDWLSELWSVLYLTAERTPQVLAAQAEWQTRLLPLAADQMAADAEGCQHGAAARRMPPPLRSG
jgi:hypothetical protein